MQGRVGGRAGCDKLSTRCSPERGVPSILSLFSLLPIHIHTPLPSLAPPSLPRYSAPPSRSYSPGPQARGYVQPVPVLPYGGFGYGFSPFSPFSPFGFVSSWGRGEEGREEGREGATTSCLAVSLQHLLTPPPPSPAFTFVTFSITGRRYDGLSGRHLTPGCDHPRRHRVHR